MDENIENSSITISCSDSKRISINIKAANRSKFIRDYVKDFPNEEMSLQNIDYPTMLYIKKYLEHYQDIKPKKIPKPLPKVDFKECVGEWDCDYINIEIEKIFALMIASNFLNIKSLLNLTSAKIAYIIKDKSPEEIKRILRMDKDIDEFQKNKRNIENKEILEN